MKVRRDSVPLMFVIPLLRLPSFKLLDENSAAANRVESLCVSLMRRETVFARQVRFVSHERKEKGKLREH